MGEVLLFPNRSRSLRAPLPARAVDDGNIVAMPDIDLDIVLQIMALRDGERISAPRVKPPIVRHEPA